MKTKNKIILSEKERTALKKVQLELFDEFDSFCRRNKLTYYLFGGTLLGAVRHNGYIPWDDDVDVCMPREDYDTFCQLYANEKYSLINSKSDKHCFYHFSKLTKNGTIYNEYRTQKLKHNKGIFIDIFPINKHPDKTKKIECFFYNFILFLFNARSYPFKYIKDRNQKRKLSHTLMYVISFILLWWCPYNAAARLRDQFLKKHQRSSYNSCIVGTNLTKVYKLSYFNGLSYVIFEGRKAPAMENPVGYLTMMYGDYMKLPDVHDRTPHHDLVEFKA